MLVPALASLLVVVAASGVPSHLTSPPARPATTTTAAPTTTAPTTTAPATTAPATTAPATTSPPVDAAAEGDAAARSVKEPVQSSALAATEAGPRVLVLQPGGTGVDPQVREAVASLLAVELGKLDGVDVVSASDVKNLAQLEAEKQTIGCDDSGACLAEIAGALGARFVVFGDAAQLGGVTVVNLALFDSQVGRTVGRTTLEAKDVADLPRKVPLAARALVKDVPEFAGRPFPPLPSDGPPLWALAGGGGLVALGAIVGGAGLAFDVFSVTSDDDEVGVLDYVGPGLMVAGAAAIVGGVALPLLTMEGT